MRQISRVRNHNLKLLCYSIGITALLLTSPTSLTAEEAIVDAVVATVEGEPITLEDLRTRLGGSEPATLKEARTKPAIKQALEMLIMETLLKADAKARRIGVSKSEVDAYLQEVATRNQLSMEEFEEALFQEGRSLEAFKAQIEVEIIKSKLAGRLFQEGIGVSDREVEEYIEENEALYSTGKSVKLNQIFVSTAQRTPEAALQKIVKAQEALENGKRFAEVAQEFSESPEAQQGGSLGVVPLQDLSETFKEAVASVDEGDLSQIARSSVGLHLFQVEKRFDQDDEEKIVQLKDEVRKTLSDRKLQSRLQQYFAKELQEQYVVDRKL